MVAALGLVSAAASTTATLLSNLIRLPSIVFCGFQLALLFLYSQCAVSAYPNSRLDSILFPPGFFYFRSSSSRELVASHLHAGLPRIVEPSSLNVPLSVYFVAMPARKSNSRTTTPRSRKGTAATPRDVTPPTPTVATVPSAPRPKRVSPRKRLASEDTPAVGIDPSISVPTVSRRLSFGTAIDASDAQKPVNTGSEEIAPVQAVKTPSVLSPSLNLNPIGSAEGTPTPKVAEGKRKRAPSTASPSPSVAKPPALSPEELKAARMANPAKRIRPIARLDSEDEGASHLFTPPAARAAVAALPDSPVPPGFGSSREDTPRPSSSQLVMSLFDNEAIEDNEVGDNVGNDDTVKMAWNSPSPPPSSKRAGPPVSVGSVEKTLRLRNIEKAKAEAKALLEKAEHLVAEAESAKLPDDNPFTAKASLGRINDPILLSDSDDEPTSKTSLELLSFPEIPPLLDGIVSALKASKILTHLRFSELLPKFTPQDSQEAQVPDVLHVMGCMVDEYAAVAIYDALLFRGRGVYVNPLIANPRDFRIAAKTVVFASGSRSPPVFVMPIVVESCSLKEMVSVNPYDQHLRLTGWLFDEVFTLFSSFIGSVFNLDTVYAYMNNLCLQFSSRIYKPDGSDSVPNTPQRTSRMSTAFKAAGSSKKKAQSTAPTNALNIRYPSSLGSTDTIPIYDGRHERGDFRCTDADWDRLPSMIRYGVPAPADNELPDNSRAQDLPCSKPDRFVVALVGFTMTCFNPKDNPTATVVSFNIQFSVLLGLYKAMLHPREVTSEYIEHIRSIS